MEKIITKVVTHDNGKKENFCSLPKEKFQLLINSIITPNDFVTRDKEITNDNYDKIFNSFISNYNMSLEGQELLNKYHSTGQLKEYLTNHCVIRSVFRLERCVEVTQHYNCYMEELPDEIDINNKEEIKDYLTEEQDNFDWEDWDGGYGHDTIYPTLDTRIEPRYYNVVYEETQKLSD